MHYIFIIYAPNYAWSITNFVRERERTGEQVDQMVVSGRAKRWVVSPQCSLLSQREKRGRRLLGTLYISIYMYTVPTHDEKPESQ